MATANHATGEALPGAKRSLKWNQLGRHEEKVLLLLTLVIGAVVGLVVVAFILLTERLGSRLYPADAAAWRRFTIPFAGALITGWLLARYFPNARGSGIPQTKTALFIRDGFISLRTVLGKFGLCSVTLASGIALGREGPSVHIGAGIASVLGRKLGLSPSSVKALVPAGASAALAAAFNTPIAAVLFSLEEVMGDMHAPVLGSIVLSSATSWMVLHLVLGDEPLFHVPAYQLVHPLEFAVYAALGVAGGLVSVAFVKLLLWQRKWFLGLPKRTVWIQPAAGGLVVGILGWFFPSVLGVGYTFVGQALNGQMVLSTMALLVFLKLAATASSYASGNAGGIFGPSLFIGAMIGGAVGGAAHMAMPDYTGSAGAYALVGMGTAFAGIVRVPMTSVIMIFEMTRDYSIIVPLMISNLISYFISSRLQDEPIYEALQHQDGIHLPSGAQAREALLTVGTAFRPEPEAVPATATIAQAMAAVDRERGAWPVVDAGGLRGMASVEQLDAAVQAGRGDEPVSSLVPDPGAVETLTEERFPHVHPDHPLEVAMRRLATSRMKVLPVVSRSNVRELKGTIALSDALAAYGIGRTETAEPEAQVSVKSPTPILAGVLGVFVAVAILIAVLHYSYTAGVTARSQNAYRAGDQMFASGRYEEAVEHYRNALSLSHTPAHRLALGLALAKAGRGNEASIYLAEVLRANPSSGPAHLAMAQIEAKRGNIDQAVAQFQRAIAGSWPQDAAANRFEAHLEMAQSLWQAGRHTQARAELLSAVAAAPPDPDRQKQLGQMLIDYGQPTAAADLFRHLVAQDSHDPAAYDGLAASEFATGDYAAARDAWRAALRIDPTDAIAAKQADLTERILALDPTIRGVGSAERYARSMRILNELLAEASTCSSIPPEDLQAARTAAGRTRRPRSYSDAAEANIALAVSLWNERQSRCGAPPDPNSPLSCVMARLAAR